MNRGGVVAIARRGAPSRRPLARRGQALVEFLVGAGVLASLLAGIVVVGRLQELQWATIAASRYAAFEHALRPDRIGAAALQGHVRARFYEPPDTPLRSDDARTDADSWRRVMPHWTDRSPTAHPLVSRPADVAVTSSEADPPGVTAGLAASVAALADRAAVVTGGRFDVNRRGYYSAAVRVRLAPFASEPAPLSTLALTLEERTTVLGDSWNSTGPQQVADRTRAFVPAAALRAVRPVLDAFRWALRLFEPALDQLCLGRIDPDLVPLDRLGEPGTGERGAWSAPC